jgi:hypothetical protein
MGGWIKAHRTLQNHYLWEDKPFSKGQAWIDILMMVNHEDGKTMVGNEVVLVKKGSRVTSELKLAERWGWSRKKTRSFLKTLEQDKMLVKKSTTKYTIVTVLNWELYQHKGTTEEQQKNNNGTTTEQQRDTNKKLKKLKNEKKKSYGEYQHVKLTDKEFESLVSEIGLDNLNYMIKKVDEYVESNRKNKPYTNYNLVIRNWMKKENFKKKEPKKSTIKPIKREDESEWDRMLGTKIP